MKILLHIFLFIFVFNTIDAATNKVLTGISGTPFDIIKFTEAFLSDLNPGAVEVKAPFEKDQALTISSDKKSFSITHNGIIRTGLTYIPKNLDTKKPISLLFGLHGMNSKASDFRLYAGLEKYAERLNFVILYPNAIDGLWEVENGIQGTYDDIGLFKRLINESLTLFKADPKRVYITGHSMGGFMSYRIGNELSEIVTAIAPVSGTFVTTSEQLKSSTTRPIGVLHIHNLDDDIVPLAGFPGYSLSLAETMDYWKKTNKVSGEIKSTLKGVQYTSSKTGSAPLMTIFYPTGQHSWRSEVSGEIFSFFYNYPSNGPKLSFNKSNIPALVHNTNEIKIVPKIEGEVSRIKSVSLVSDGKILNKSSNTPFSLNFQPKMMQYYSLELFAELTDGTQILSTEVIGLTTIPDSIAKNAVASATSSESDSQTAKYVLDGNFETRWSSEAKDDQSIIIDLGKVQDVKAVTIFWEAAIPLSYSIESSLDGKTWKKIMNIPICSGGVDIQQFPKENLRYIKIQGEKRASSWGISMWEVFIH